MLNENELVASNDDLQADEKQKTMEEPIKNLQENTQKSNDDDEIQLEIKKDKMESYNLIYPISLFHTLQEKNRVLVYSAKHLPKEQFKVGIFLIEGKNDFPQNISVGFKYIEESAKNNYVDAIVYYIRALIKGKIIQQNFEKANEYLSRINSKHKNYFALKGLISRKNNKYKQAMKYFRGGIEIEDAECIYQYGKMLFLGEGIKKNIKEALKYFNQAKVKRYEKGDKFVIAYNRLNEIKKFSSFPVETQMIFISNNIKELRNINNQMNLISDGILFFFSEMYKNESQFRQFFIPSKKTEKLFFNGSLKSTVFYKFLRKYQNVCIEVCYSKSASFNSILELVRKIKNKKINNLKIGIVFAHLPQIISSSCFNSDVLYYKIDTSVQNIPSKAFQGCSSLINITIPSSITSIGSYAFDECSSLKQISIPSSVTEIDEGSFKGCSSIERIVISSVVNEIKDYTFDGCSSLKQIFIPLSVTSIGRYAFHCCSSLVQITIPSSVNSIGDCVFCGCSSLKQIFIPSSVTSIGNSAFKGCSSLIQMSFLSSIEEIEENSSIGRIIILPDVKIIKDYTFDGCSSFYQIVIPSSTISIGDCAFNRCSSLKQISIPSSVASIGNYAFRGCSLLKQITIPSSVTSIGKSVFDDCTSLECITIPSSLNMSNVAIDSKVKVITITPK